LASPAKVVRRSAAGAEVDLINWNSGTRLNPTD
jgi:hypothetical protein